MAKFYAIGETKGKESKSVRINFDILDKQPTTRHEAEKIAKDYSNKNGLNYIDTYVEQGTQKQPSTMTKFFKYRKANNNQNPRSFSKSL